MDGRQPEYTQSGLHTPYSSVVVSEEQQSETSSPADQASAAHYNHAGQDPRSANFSSSATPTSEYGLAPGSARSGSFPEYIQRQYHQSAAGGQGATPAAGMAQPQSPSSTMPLSNGQAGAHGHGHHHGGGHGPAHPHDLKTSPSNHDLPIDPSIAAATSPTYPQHPQYSPYGAPQHDMNYPGHPGVYGRPEWAGGAHYPQQQHMSSPYGHSQSSGPPTPAMVSPVQHSPSYYNAAGYQGGHPLSTVYSFVPIPGAQQHKRPRRRYEEIERMYKCGWHGCEKAYGTLNHLNAHVTMQGHGQKRTPEEFKEIRKEWKAKKKEEEAARKAEDERQRSSDGRPGPDGSNGPDTPVYGQMRGHPGQNSSMGGPQLPPIGYAPAGSQAPPNYGQQSPAMDGMPQYPQSPYGQGSHIYQQHGDNGAASFQQ